MRARIATVWLLGAAAWATVACSDDSSSAGNKDQFIAQLCDEYMGCCKSAGRPSDGAQCRAFYGAFAPATGYDAALGQACLDEVRARKDECDTSSDSAPSCRKVFASASRGSAQPGEACEDDSDCAAPAEGEVQCESDFVDGTTIQQCQVQLTGTAGSTPCLGTVDGNVTIYSGSADGIPKSGYLCRVADGLSCQTGACKKMPEVGEACTGGSYACVPSAYCDFAASMCKARVAVGAACTDDDECAAAAYCEPTGSTCAARRALGESCSMNAECQSSSCTNQKCASDNDFALALLCGGG
jgi:hypothetical protein